MQDVNNLIREMKDLPTGYAGAFVYTSLIDAVSWLKRASEILTASSTGGIRRFHVTDAEDILTKSQVVYYCYSDGLSYPHLRISLNDFKLDVGLYVDFHEVS